MLLASLVVGVLAGCGEKGSALKSIDDEAIEDMRGFIDRDVAAGLYSEEEIIDSVVDLLAIDYDSAALRPLAEEHTRAALKEHLREQRDWPVTTDCDRLDSAFAELETAGIVCRQDFSCCGTCGVAEIRDEIEETRDEGMQVHGYTFYHAQDTESAIEGDGLYLNYGATEEGEKAALRVANEIAAALKKHQLRVEWDGTWETRIGVELDWKRRVVR